MNEDNPNYQQQQLEDERQQLIYEALDKVSRGLSTHTDARFLAGELGVKYKENEYGKNQ